METRGYRVVILSLPLLSCLSACGYKSNQIVLASSISPQASGSAYWTAPTIGSTNELGTVVLPQSGAQAQYLLHPGIYGNGGPLVCTATSWNSAGTRLKITYKSGSAKVNVVVQVTGTNTEVQAQLDADQPLIALVDMGPWDGALNTRPIAVPYYSTNIWYAQRIAQYVNSWLDWHTSHATSLNGTGAQYLRKTDGTLNTMHELLNVVASPNLDDVLPTTGNSPSPYLKKLSGRLVLDVWDLGFSGIEQGLAELGDYGISNCVLIIHNWQHDGYDNALPQHYSANPSLGGASALQAAIAQGNENGCYSAVHENYIDYYPNYPLFTASAVALNSDGTRMIGWLNPTTGIQSFSTKPKWMVTNAETQSPIIHQQYGTTAAFQDVLSAAPISTHGDMDSHSAGAGMLTTWTAANESLWRYERQIHNGPVFGEGGNHWQYSGLLDGVEAQLGTGDTPMNSDASLALFVDFDLLRIHPLQVNHGMGYYERWTAAATALESTTQMDAYRMQEIAFGHAPYLSNGLWSDIWHAFIESNLVTPAATSYGTAHAKMIQYRAKGSWVTPSEAARVGDFTQVQVGYDNGLTVVANASASTLAWDGLSVPQYGWAAKSSTLNAFTALCGATICDYAETPTTVFANARNQADAKVGQAYAAPSVAKITPGTGGSFSITYQWLVYRSPDKQLNYVAFVHFVEDAQAASSNGGIVFQDDHLPSTPTSHWSPRQLVMDGPQTVPIPSSVPDGTYSIRIGLYDAATGQRLQLAGDNDGTARYILGAITISNKGTRVAFTPQPASAADPRLNAAGTVVTFPTIKTDGMISITQKDGQWVLRPFPRFRNFTVLLKTSKFTEPTIVNANGLENSTVIPVSVGPYWQLNLNGSSSYSWPVQ